MYLNSVSEEFFVYNEDKHISVHKYILAINTQSGEVMLYLLEFSPMSSVFWSVFESSIQKTTIQDCTNLDNEHTKPNSIKPTAKRPWTSWLIRQKRSF